jgi:uncharacterized protein (TIGR02001 family)
MFKKTIIAGLVAGAFAPALAFAQAAAAPASDHTLTGNFGVYSQYIFRGLTQTNKDPALQGGLDYSHSSGLYAGAWMSNISWLTDSPGVTGYNSSSLEMDFYGGYKGTFGKSDFGYDVGILQYYYPGTHSTVVNPGTFKADTLELYGAVTWKWLSAKYSHSINDETFGVNNSDGTYYFDLSANYPVTDKLTLMAHYGIQKFKGTSNLCGANTSNDSCASYDDWKIGASYALPQSFTIGGFFTGTDMTTAQKTNYTNAANAGSRFLGKDTFTVYLSKTF